MIAAAAIYLLAIRDRDFQSYAGVKLGMQLGTALSHLQANGYMILDDAPIPDRDCTAVDEHTLVYAKDPTYSLTISPDRSCKVSRIARRRRGMEL
jgi:hypothetical protein